MKSEPVIRKPLTIVTTDSEEPMTDFRRWVRQYVEAVAVAKGIPIATRVKAA